MDSSSRLAAVLGRTIAERYVVEGPLGRGGMAAVYQVRDERTGRRLALKRSRTGDARVQGRREALLRREYETLAQLAHPRIIEVYDFGVDDDGPYYVMELLDGADLDAGGVLQWQEVCSLLRDVASSLDILHSRGLVHRDVSGRNVRRTADGRAKLIDFGAMTAMGVAKDVVGTPPFMAPEALQMQALDGRVDLFSLGALAYHLLTGRHAFPARRMSELRDLWRSRPGLPGRNVLAIPTALGDLVLQLLSLDRNARPQTAAEVISRLCVIAQLPFEEHDMVSNAYLAAPTLVARERALVAVRKRLLSLRRGDGGTLLIEGAPGSGRSRILDVCALETKLLGAAVVRIDAGDAGSHEFAAMRALGRQLFQLMPRRARELARLQRHLLMNIFEELAGDDDSSLSLSFFPERRLLVQALRDFVISLARREPMLIAVDDFERLDEGSRAVLAAIASKSERNPLVIAFAVDREQDDTASAALRLLRSVCDPVELSDLSAEQTEALVRSIFGDVANLPLVAGRIHALAHGNPRATIELAQHMVSKGIVRHAAGRFSLPDELDDSLLPATFAASLRARLDGLGDDARELCELLCIADGVALNVDQYPELTAHRDPRRVSRAVDELMAARVLVADAERYRFSHRGILTVLAEHIPAPSARKVHARLAHLLERTAGDPVRRGYHLFGSGDELAALDAICKIDLTRFPAPLPLLARAVSAAERLGCKPSTTHRLRMGLLIEAQTKPDVECFRAHAPAALAQLECDSSLALFHELTRVSANDRLKQAIAITHERYLSTPEHERVLSVTDAIPELARLCSLYSGIGLWSFDLDFIESFPSLAPLEPLSPALAVVARFAEAAREWVRGRYDDTREIYRNLLARIDEPDRAGLQDVQHDRLRLGLHLLLGLLEAWTGNEAAHAHADILQASRTHLVSAWRVRQILHLSRGDSREARLCMRRAELCQLQDGDEQHNVGATSAVEMIVYAVAGDVLALRGAIDGVAQIAGRHPHWQPVLIFGQSRLLLLLGDAAGALDQLSHGHELAPLARHWCFPLFSAARVEALTELGRIDEAITLARDHVALCERERLSDHVEGLAIALAHALACAGSTAEAVILCEKAIARLERSGRTGIALGAAWEARARIALDAADSAGFERAMERCAGIFTRHQNPSLVARVARLLSDAQTITGCSAVPVPAGLDSVMTDVSESEYHTIESRMQECVDAGDRARCALTMVLQHMETFAGYLYGVGPGGLRLMAGLPEEQPQAELDGWIRMWFANELASSGTAEVTGEAAMIGDAHAPDRHRDGAGRVFEPILVSVRENGHERVAAVLVVHAELRKRGASERQLLQRMAVYLIDHQDVEGVVVEPTETVTNG